MELIDGSLGEYSFVFTGALDSGMTRNEATDYVMSHGGWVESRITTETSHLVAKNPNSQTKKLQDAIKRGILVISEQELWKLAGMNPKGDIV